MALVRAPHYRPETDLDGHPLARAVERARDGGCVSGADDRILLWNRAAERMLGYTAREVVGRPCREVFGGRDDRGNRICYAGCQVATLTRMGEPVSSFDMQTTTRQGRSIWLNVSILTLPSDLHDRSLLVHLFRDVTASKELLLSVAAAAVRPRDGEPPQACDALTPRELEVLRVMATGAGTKTCAERLRVSRATVRNHAQNILTKLGVHSRLEAVAFARKHHLL